MTTYPRLTNEELDMFIVGVQMGERWNDLLKGK